MPSGIFTLKQQELALGQGAWTNQKPLAVDYLVVAGGGGAGASGPGGAGAGGVLLGSVAVASGSAITVTVGGGGSGTSGSSAPGNGSNSVFGSVSATGGGKGENNAIAAGSGGSGGGVGSSLLGAGQGTAGQGNAGGSTYVNNGGGASSGGGGAGTAGGSPVVYNAGGAGGAGVGSAISGTLTGYGGGGGGSVGNTGTGYYLPPASYGGGGAGGIGANGGSGTANTGGGGGAAPSYTGGNGGSGIVIVSYPDIYAAAASTTGSPTVSTSGSGSIFFGGSSQYLTYSANSFSTSGNWTIEAWCYFTSSSNNDTVVNGLASDRLYLTFIGTTFFVGDGITNNISASNAKLLNQWFHLAVVKNGSTYTAYINGSSIGSSTTALTSTTLTTWQVGGRPSIASYTQGYLSNVRIVTSAVYTGNFTVPTTPLAAISNTQLLLSSVSGAYLTDSSTNANAPTMVNTVTWNSLSPFATGLGYKNRVYTWTSSGSITF